MKQVDPIALQHAERLCSDGDTQNAYKLAQQLFKECPEDARLANLIAHCHLKAERPETAYYIYRYIQKFKDYDGPHLWHNLGHCLAEREHWKEAESFFLKALQKTPDHITYSSLASIYCKNGDPKKAIEYAEKSLALKPDSQEAFWNGALALLKLRQWEKGWEWYDSLLGSKKRPKPPAIDGVALPIWEGCGGVVLVNGEQGLGDEIMFSSIIKDAQKMAERIILAVDPRLVPLFQRSFPGVFVTSRTGKELYVPEPVTITHRYPLGSLGRLFRLNDSDFPGEPYLKADPERALMYRALLNSLGEGKKVGIMWRGGVGGLDEFERSLSLNDLEPLFSEKVTWVSLNHLPEAKEECERFYDVTGIKIHHFPFSHTRDYDDTAALVDGLDHVVSVTGTVAHCAAALGKDTHVLVPRMAQWRYGHEGSDIPWYKSMTLHRQTDKWPLEEVGQAIDADY
jgi:pentatricopeptide repeat protein